MSDPCRECAETGRKGYCAPLRCYCGHQTCHAFASWREPVAPDITLREVAKTSAWSNREEPTWIDQM